MKNRKDGIYAKYIKRILDITLCLIAFVLFWWVYVIIAILVRINLGSPVIYHQKRPGMINRKTGKEKIFRLYKFRSMTNETDADGKLLPDTKRLTRFGKILRASSLDELPELWNIFIGDMSIIGPRPLAVIYLDYYTEEEHHRHDVRPGMSGLAQTHGRNSITWEDRFAYDLKYVDEISFKMDVKLVFDTIVTVLKHQGIGEGEQIENSLNRIRAKHSETVQK